MSGAIEGGVQVATGFMDSLKREPLSLALVVMNMCLLLFFYFILTSVANQREREISLLYTDKKEARELLSRCVVPQKTIYDKVGEWVGTPPEKVPELPPIRPLPTE